MTGISPKIQYGKAIPRILKLLLDYNYGCGASEWIHLFYIQKPPIWGIPNGNFGLGWPFRRPTIIIYGFT